MESLGFSLDGRSALITGGNGGIGLAIARGYQAAGAAVAITGQDQEKNSAARAALGDQSLILALDVRDEAAVAETISAVASEFGRLDILVNNAGVFLTGDITEKSLEEWDTVVGVNLTGAFLCTKYAAQAMRIGRHGGKMINIGSMYSLFGQPNGSDYVATKTGLLGLTRAMAVELAPDNIQVNAILPGFIKTEMSSGLAGTELGDQIRRKTPANRWGVPRDVVGTAVFLASAASDFVSGVAIPVDGGYAVTERLLYP